jgi:large subunit ribosomal protein L15
MLINTLQLKEKRKKRKTIGRGGKKGTYSGRGNKGQKARSGGNVNPLFEGGRSTLIDHVKKKKGFTAITAKKNIVDITDLEKKFKNDDVISAESLVKANLVKKVNVKNGIKILGIGEMKVKLTIEKNILLSKSAKAAIEKAGGKIITEQKTADKE